MQYIILNNRTRVAAHNSRAQFAGDAVVQDPAAVVYVSIGQRLALDRVVEGRAFSLLLLLKELLLAHFELLLS